jgi:Flp pilus assembly protein TadD
MGTHLQDVLGSALPDQPDEPPRELTVDEAIELAIQLHQQGHLDGAEIVYREIRRVDPDNARALHFSGILTHQLGRSAEAADMIRRSLAASPGQADWHNNLGIVLQESGHLDEAIEAYRAAIALNPEHATAYSNLGVLLRATGQSVGRSNSIRHTSTPTPTSGSC